MTILVWLILGLVAGRLASLLMGIGRIWPHRRHRRRDPGAMLGGWLGSMFLGIDVTGLNLTSIAVAVVGAVIVIAIFRAVAPGKRTTV